MERCLYCGNLIEDRSLHVKVKNDTYLVCSQECKANAEMYIEKERRQKFILYWIMFFLAVGYLIITAFQLQWKGIGAIPICAGIAIMMLPYPVTFSYKSLHNCPIKKLIKYCKTIGIAFTLFGILLLIM